MPAQKHLFIKLASGISAFLVVGYLGISAYAGHTLSKPNRCFDPLKASVFAVPPENVTFVHLMAWRLLVGLFQEHSYYQHVEGGHHRIEKRQVWTVAMSLVAPAS